MTGFFVAIAIVGWFAAFLYTGWRALEDESKGWIAATAVVVVLGVGTIANVASHEDDSGPCLRHETRYMMVGKVMTPYTVCVERGEWVK